VSRLVGDQLEENQPQLAGIEDPTAPATAAGLGGVAPAAVAEAAAAAAGHEVMAVRRIAMAAVGMMMGWTHWFLALLLDDYMIYLVWF